MKVHYRNDGLLRSAILKAGTASVVYLAYCDSTRYAKMGTSFATTPSIKSRYMEGVAFLSNFELIIYSMSCLRYNTTMRESDVVAFSLAMREMTDEHIMLQLSDKDFISNYGNYNILFLTAIGNMLYLF